MANPTAPNLIPAATSPAGGAVVARGADDWLTFRTFALLLGVLVLAAFPQVFLGREVFFFRDFGSLGYPFAWHLRESLWRGELPLWNPLVNCGVPFLAQWGPMVLYPFNLFYVLLPMPWSLSVFGLLHLWWGGLGMYRLAGEWTGRRFAAAFAGVGFAFGGVMVASLVWPNYMVALGWMPWMVWLVQRAWREGGRWLAASALAGTMQMLTGAPELILQTWAFIAALWAADNWPLQGGRWRFNGRALARLAAVVALVAGLAAAQLLPFFQLLRLSDRGAGYADATVWAMPGWGLANLIAPLFHYYRTPQGTWLQTGQLFIVTYYVGAAVMALGIVALWRARSRLVWLLGGATLLALLLALGNQAFLHPLMERLFPLGFARYPVKYVLLAAFTLPALAALGVARLATPTEAKAASARKLLGWAGLGSLALLGLLALLAWRLPFPRDAWPETAVNTLWRGVWLVVVCVGAAGAFWMVRARSRVLVQLVALLALWFDLWTHLPVVQPTIAPWVFTPGLAQEKAQLTPRPEFGAGRVMISPFAARFMQQRMVPDFVDDFIGARLAFAFNLPILDSLPSVAGASTLQTREQKRLIEALYDNPAAYTLSLTDFLGATHITQPGELLEWGTRSNALPLVTAGQQAVFIDRKTALRELLSTNWNPRESVFLFADAAGEVTATNRVAAVIHSRQHAAQRIVAEVETPAPTMLVVAQAFHPAWQALVDDRPARLWRANGAFQAVEVPMGRHTVEMVYRDRWFAIGAIVSAASLAICVWLWRRGRVRPG
jgi:hypothetical protein